MSNKLEQNFETGSKSLIIASGRIGNPQESLQVNAKQMTFAASSFQPPQKKTYYSCTTFEIPALDKKHHVVRVRSV